MIVADDGSTKKELLNVCMQLNKKGQPVLNWDFGDKENVYFMIGVLEVIKDELLQELAEQSDSE